MTEAKRFEKQALWTKTTPFLLLKAKDGKPDPLMCL
jgi:hypothetical protein